MTLSRLIFAGLAYHWRRQLWVVAGALIATAVLTGSLLVGDSVRGSLRRQALTRLAGTVHALAAGDVFFEASLAERLRAGIPGHLAIAPSPAPESTAETGRELVLAPILQLRGLAVAADGVHRVNHLQVLGVDSAFWDLPGGGGGQAPSPGPAPGAAWLGAPLAARLGAKVGDELLVRVEVPAQLPLEAPLGMRAQDQFAKALRVKVAMLLPADSGPGGFSLRARPGTVNNLFVSRDWLARELDLVGKANLLCVGGQRAALALPAALDRWLRDSLVLGDLGLELRELPQQQLCELRSRRVFLPPAMAAAALQAGTASQGIFTYFLTAIRAGAKSTPYSFVAAAGTPLVPPDLGEREVVVNAWLAEDLGLKPGDAVELEYPVEEAGIIGKRTRSMNFTVHAVIPMTGAALDPELMPDFPGLAGAESCRDWKPGLDIDLARIRPQDEAYWNTYRGTPKVFVSLKTAQTLWGNRFGSLTAVRWPLAQNSHAELVASLRHALGSTTSLAFQPVREQALQGVAQGVDFGGLFVGLSFFMVAAALLLMALLFALNTQRRDVEIGTLLALGFSVSQVKGLLLLEATVLALTGSVLGAAAGVAYTRLVLLALTTVWQGATGAVPLTLEVTPLTLTAGILAGTLTALAAVAVMLWRLTLRPVFALQRGLDSPPAGTCQGAVFSRGSVALFAVSAGGAAALAFGGHPEKGMDAAGSFMGAGALVLVALSVALLWCLRRADRRAGSAAAVGLSLGRLAVLNAARRPGRSLAVAGLLATGLFLVVAVAANRPAVLREDRTSGTGGFRYYGEAILPLIGDLNAPAWRERHGLPATGLVSFVGLRVHDGDDASCLSLTRAQTPRILGVDPMALDQRGAFGFSALGDWGPNARCQLENEYMQGGRITMSALEADAALKHPWLGLCLNLGPEVVPVMADQTVILWGLGKKVGDEITVRAEDGHDVRLRFVAGLANSVFQGSLLMSEAHFRKLYPSVGGARILLAEGEAQTLDALAKAPPVVFQDAGVDFERTRDRLAQFNRVESTYLTIFFVLGACGLLLGTVGLGVVLLRNLEERRGELALLQATGYERRHICGLLWREHALLVAAGSGMGTLAALLGMLPALRTGASGLSWSATGGLVFALLASAALTLYLAARRAAGSNLLEGLREE